MWVARNKVVCLSRLLLPVKKADDKMPRGRPQTSGKSHNPKSASYAHDQKRTADLLKSTGGGIGRFLKKRPRTDSGETQLIHGIQSTVTGTEAEAESASTEPIESDDTELPGETQLIHGIQSTVTGTEAEAESASTEPIESDDTELPGETQLIHGIQSTVTRTEAEAESAATEPNESDDTELPDQTKTQPTSPSTDTEPNTSLAAVVIPTSPAAAGTVATVLSVDTDPDATESDHDLDIHNGSSNSDSSETDQGDKDETSACKVDGRSFRGKQWEIRYPWLYFNQRTDGHHCKICEAWFTSGKWASDPCSLGSHSGRILSSHQSSSKHQQAVRSMKLLKKCKQKGNIFSQILAASENSKEAVVTKNRTLVKKLLKVVHFMSSKKWAVRNNFEDFIRFVANKLDSEDLSTHILKNQRNAMYLSSQSVDEFTNAIGTYLEESTLSKIMLATDIALSADETTIVDGREELAVFITYMDELMVTVKTDFIGLIHVAQTNSAALLESIKTIFIAKGLDITKVRFSGLDGTNSMSGEISGLQRRLRHLSPHALYMNCRNHRLALVLVHLMKEFPFISNVDSVLEGLWKLFHYSPQKNEILKNVQEAETIRSLKILKVSTTRWLTHGEASIRLLQRFNQVLDALDSIISSKNCPTSIGLRNLLLKPNTLKGLVILADVLKLVNILCKTLQERNLPIATLSTKVIRIKEKICDLFRNPDSPHRHWMKKSVEDEIFGVALERGDLARRNRSDSTSGVSHTIDIKRFESRLLQELDTAFQVNPVVSAFDLFNPPLLPDKDDQEYNSYGETEIQKLAEFYSVPMTDTFQGSTKVQEPVINQLESDELSHFKDSLCEAKRHHRDFVAREITKMRLSKSEDDIRKFMDANKSMPLIKAYRFLKCDNGEQFFPNILRLFRLSLILPTSTAEVERGFSCLNLLCTDLRSTLSQTNLEHLMRINLLQTSSELTDEDWEGIVDVFNRKPRRIDLSKV